jgi:NADH-quinone oxidoreductase subunit I
MRPLTNKAKVVSNKKMTFAERLYLPAIAIGMWTTLKHLFGKATTIRYPEVKRDFSDIYRGKHVLKRDDEGRERCTACGLCAVACPAEAITMVAEELTRARKTFTGKRSMHLSMKLTCCAAYSVVCAKKPAQKKLSS